MSDRFPDLGDWHDTRRSLHAWSKALSAVRRALSEPHPRWWHISLGVTPRGLGTGPLPGSPDGLGLALELDLVEHRLVLDAGDGGRRTLALGERPTATRLGDWILDRMERDHGIEAETKRGKWQDDSPRGYDPGAAGRYLAALRAAHRVLGETRDGLTGERGPVQLWAHHFDLAFELFGSRRVASEEAEGGEQPAQIGFGFFPGDDDGPEAYFYATPWPFDERLMESPLPSPAAWQKEPWEGARLPYPAAVSGGGDLVGKFLRAVWGAGRSVLD